MESLVHGLSTTVIGIVTVIVILIVIALVITLMGRIMKKAEKPAPAAEEAGKPAPAQIEGPAAPALTDDYALVAAITAAVSAYTGMSPSRFKIFDIKQSDSQDWRKANKKLSNM